MRKYLQHVLLAFLLVSVPGGCDKETSKTNPDVSNESANVEPADVKQEVAEPEIQLVSSRYVPDRVCADCHEEIWNSYQHVGMAQSAYTFESRATIEDFENGSFFHQPSRKHYQMELEGEHMFMSRYRVGADGERIHELKKRVDFVIGSGNHSRTYAYREASGDMFQMPVAWYSQSGTWEMAPGYDHAKHDDFGRQITRDCMFCHNAYPELDPESENSLMPATFPQQLPHGIGCQRCHGPGEEHVKAAEKDPQAADVMTTIMNSSKLPAQQSEDVCNQCHLQPTSKRTSFLRHFDRGAYSFRPGEKLSDFQSYWDLYDADEKDLFEVNHHAYRMHRSKCYIESEGAMNCVTCHDPHAHIPKENRAAHYRSKCLECHGPQDCLDVEQGHQPTSDCAKCHMPMRRSEDAVHVVMTDHKIVRPDADRDLVAPLKESKFSPTHPVNDYKWLRETAKVDAVDQRVGHTVMSVIDGEASALGLLYSQIANGDAKGDEPRAHLAKAFLELGKSTEALQLINGMSAAGKRSSAVQSNVGLALIQQQNFSQAATILERASTMKPVVPEAYFNLGIAYINTDRMDAAIEQFEKAVETQSNLANARFYLASALARDKQFDRAEQEFQNVLQIDPDYPGAAVSLSNVQALQDKYVRAIKTLENEREYQPANVGIAEELAMLSLEAVGLSKVENSRSLNAAKTFYKIGKSRPSCRLIVSVAFLQNGDNKRALEAVGKTDLKTKDPLRLLIAAIAQSRLQNPKLANQLYEKAMEILGGKSPTSRLQKVVMPLAEQAFASDSSGN